MHHNSFAVVYVGAALSLVCAIFLAVGFSFTPPCVDTDCLQNKRANISAGAGGA